MIASSVAAACSSKLNVRRTFAQRQAPRAIDPAAERRVNHQLHAAGLIEEALE